MTLRKTCYKEEMLEISPDIPDLAKGLLNDSEVSRAEELSEDLAEKRFRENAISELQGLFCPPPKRPLFYLEHELGHLPRWTRDSIRYMGDYIDLLVKATLFSKTSTKKWSRLSLGPALKEVLKQKLLPDTSVHHLNRYNQIFYVPAKHEFNTKGRRHRFTAKEVVYCAFITTKLAEELRRDELVNRIASDKVDFEFAF